MLPALLGVSVTQISLLINPIFASFLPSGSVSWLYYADRLMEFPAGLLGAALGTIFLPSLSRSHAENDRGEFSALLDWGLRLTFLLTLPAALALALLAVPLLATLFNYGAFQAVDVLKTRDALLAYSVGLLLRSLDIARLRAQIDQDHDDYQKRPKRKFVGARTKEYRFARYVEDWRIKVERIGNLNYPEAARKGKLYGNLQLTVSIRANGSLESIEIHRSSVEKILDEAAINIVKLAGQNGFASFPPDISQDTDILHITRTWVFAPSDMLLSQ